MLLGSCCYPGSHRQCCPKQSQRSQSYICMQLQLLSFCELLKVIYLYRGLWLSSERTNTLKLRNATTSMFLRPYHIRNMTTSMFLRPYHIRNMTTYMFLRTYHIRNMTTSMFLRTYQMRNMTTSKFLRT